jgi:carboxypeptidase Q
VPLIRRIIKVPFRDGWQDQRLRKLLASHFPASVFAVFRFTLLAMIQRIFTASALLVLSCSLVAQTAAPASDASTVIPEALKAPMLEDNLRTLTNEIGGRVPGTPAMQKAIQWAFDAFKTAGADKVMYEPFRIARSWSERATRVRVVSPVSFPVHAVSLAWTPPLTPAKQYRIISVGHGNQEEFAKAGDFAGAVVLVDSDTMKSWDDLFQEYLRAPGIIDQAIKGKAVAIAFTSTREHDLLYRHINTQTGQIDRLPMVLLAREDAKRILQLLKQKKKVQVELDVPNRIGPSIRSSNVAAEITGSELPDEFVLLGAHLDSWELGIGALDNGCNAALVIEALHAIKASRVKPRRSIRFVLFSGEEQGLLGSNAYVMRHRPELDKASAVIIFDEGTGKTTGFSLGGRKDISDRVSQLLTPFKNDGVDTLTTDAFFGTDNLDFLLEGVPTLVANQQEANYLENYHASSDTFDKVDIPQLKKHVALAAYLTLAIANLPERLGPRQDREQVEALMRETKLDEQLKTFGLWDQWESGKRGREK